MVDEAKIADTPGGKVAETAGWFVMHATEAPWVSSERFGGGCRFEGANRFPELGLHLRVLEPGVPACLYHSESVQENFFVVSGECTLVVEEQERSLRAGHFVHCPAGTRHVFVGAGEGPCAIIMVGHRSPDQTLLYPVSLAADRYGASVATETDNPGVAYGDMKLEPAEPQWPLYGVE